MGAAQKYKQTELARQAGEIARLKILRGPDLGVTFVIRSAVVSIGRGEENDVVLTDMRASRKHCELRFANGGWSVVDASSANGIAVNGQPSRHSAIKTRDTIGLGETIIEFASAEAGTLMLVAPPSSLEQLRAEQANLDLQRARVQAMSRMGGLAKNKPRLDQLSNSPAPAAPAVPNASTKKELNPVVLLAAAGIMGYLILSGNPSPQVVKLKAKGDDRSQVEESKISPPDFGDAEAVTKTADLFFKTGFREYRLGNYLRAKSQFENVLQIVPDHRLAKIYLKNSENRIEEEVKLYLDFGRKNLEAGKLTEAKGDFETVLRLLFKDPMNPAYIEAHDQLDKVHKQLAGGIDS
jgi:pSer/pThr/pTyr-binding forkhead associated (FHA) protein